jgi:hypothetical protein
MTEPQNQTVQQYPAMGDAAFAEDLDGTSFTAVAGYLSSPNAFHAWSRDDWRRIPGPKLPIYVAGMSGMSGIDDADSVLVQLGALGVPSGRIVAVDMENRVDITYINHFYAVMHQHRYKVWVYGSADSVFHMPVCNGYWVADYAGIGPFMYAHKTVRATQWTNGPLYDQSTVMAWALREFWQ